MVLRNTLDTRTDYVHTACRSHLIKSKLYALYSSGHRHKRYLRNYRELSSAYTSHVEYAGPVINGATIGIILCLYLPPLSCGYLNHSKK